MGVIFDLDQTIVDSSIARDLRRQRKWSDVYNLIPRFELYEGMYQLIGDLYSQGVPMCIVTSSPSAYCARVLAHFQIPIESKVCYHDTAHKKPHPEPILKAINSLGITPGSIFSIGDDAKDIIASHAAGVKKTVGALWGAIDDDQLRQSSPLYLCNNTKELRRTLIETGTL